MLLSSATLLGLSLACAGVALAALRFDFGSSVEDFPNPERGFFYEPDPPIMGDGATYYPQSLASLQALRTTSNISICRWYFIIDEFKTAPLSVTALTFVNDQLAIAREAGIKVIPRFAYVWKVPAKASYPYHVPDANLTVVLMHISQLTPLLRANVDVIAFLEAGFIGAWGEWHSSTHNLISSNLSVNDNTRAIVSALLAALPSSRMLAIRWPAAVMQLVQSDLAVNQAVAFSGLTAESRMGFYDDCLLSQFSSKYSALPVSQVNFVRNQSLFAVQTGETCVFAKALLPYVACDFAQAYLASEHFSALNLVGGAPKITRYWQSFGCFRNISANLGYRLRLVSVQWTANHTNILQVAFQISNDGYASPYNPRTFELGIVAAQFSNQVIGLTLISSSPDPRRFAAGEISSFSVLAALPSSLLQSMKNPRLAVRLGDPLLPNRSEYAIRLSNSGFNFTTQGWNVLLPVSFSL